MATYTAITGSTLAWETDANWVGGTQPQNNTDDVIIPNGSEVVIAASGNEPATITVQSGGVLKFDSSSVSWTGTVITVESGGIVNYESNSNSPIESMTVAGTVNVKSGTTLYGTVAVQDGGLLAFGSSWSGTVNLNCVITAASGGTVTFSMNTSIPTFYGKLVAAVGSTVTLATTASGSIVIYGVWICLGTTNITLVNDGFENYGYIQLASGSCTGNFNLVNTYGTIKITGAYSFSYSEHFRGRVTIGNGGTLTANNVSIGWFGVAVVIEEGGTLSMTGGSADISSSTMIVIESGGTLSITSSAGNHARIAKFNGGTITDINNNYALLAVDATLARVPPAVGDVRSGTTYAGSQMTGTLTLPAEGDVRDATQYGAAGTEYTGSLGGGTVTIAIS